MKRYVVTAFIWLLLVLPLQAAAEELLMARSKQPFPETMLALQESIRAHGYTVSRVQRVDIGLTGMGYKTDKYRIVFAGKLDEIRYLSEKAPQLIPYLPPKISIFAEGSQTILVSANPKLYAEIAGDAVEPAFFDRWESDLRSIFYDVSKAE
ncbi:MAG: DUF302 domain-containing protein [Gammaproteobacteria bacterium]|nr:DUF302 domain-containing protein [Gammaproteobacteria bacterium]MDH3560623.1 DUF302 domain-containing protein [Gammaproteobacteria bacterium]